MPTFFWQPRSKHIEPAVCHEGEKSPPQTVLTPIGTTATPIVFPTYVVTTQKYLNDPMRITSTPDVLGHFHDPMSLHYKGRRAPFSYDFTNTGA
ncbi:predicted protein [Lichtheimia corymbifera JMRC:FSU:9682]|uniref:Uncharacterized protein n=1 Tax=Lichtheimia corymbifera JMRC:FSU:9682 TaxID=1263082 RepID=A0A068RRU3_9FUNG|nr:predicted protein [Lichtheimia corymbifera JMRC:FSU:9682]